MTSSDAINLVSSARNPAAMHYRPDLDGMRAVAVVAVILFHGFHTYFPGGFIGVDIFFVLSGYLISAVILNGLSHQEFSFAGFYARRIRRIFPALVVVLVFTLAAGWYVLVPHEWYALAKSVFGGAAFISNFLHPAGDGYFNDAARTEPLMHLWSLGIEEQFYLVWPLALFLLWKLSGNGRRGGTVFAGILLVAGLSFAYDLHMLATDPEAAFFNPLTRAWELMAGAALAWIVAGRGVVQRRAIAELSTAAGIALLVAGFALINEGSRIPGPWTILPVAGTLLLIGAGSSSWFHSRMLASRPLVALGLISYPLYLWHWILLVFFSIVHVSFDLSNQRERAAKLILIVLAVILSWATYRFVETPMRFSVSIPPAFRVASLLQGMSLVAIVAALGLSVIQPRLHSRAVRELERAKDDLLWMGNWKMAPFQTFEFPSSDSAHATLMVGDSHMEHYIPRAKAAIKANPRLNTPVFATSGECAPLPGINQNQPDFRCPAFYEYWNGLARQDRFSTVAISAAWFAYGPAAPLTFHGHRATAADFDEAWTQLAVDLRALLAEGKRVVVFEDNPNSYTFDPAVGYGRLNLPGFLHLTGVPRAEFERYQQSATLRLKELQRRSGVEILPVRDYLCNEMECPALDTDGTPIYHDTNHLRASKAAKLATYVDDVLKP